ncbi:MAG: DNA-deoxyinosine glycosylase [Bacteroidota bacterium]
MDKREAIEKLLQQTRRPMIAREIANELNKNKWYVKGDKSLIKTSQITARVDNHPDLFFIDRTVSPLQIILLGRQLKPIVKSAAIKTEKPKVNKPAININMKNLKTSFDSISDSETMVLILGTMPGDKSLQLGEYYGHPRNRFWKIISTITNHELPLIYSDKKALLLKTKIGVWDVAHKAHRKGSLDSAIEGEEPNDLNKFITSHKNLRVIGFNGTKAETLYDKYFVRTTGIKYISLPSTSPANTGISFDSSCTLWRQLLSK